MGAAEHPARMPFFQRWLFRGTASLAVLLIFGAANNFGDPSTTGSSAIRRSVAGLAGAGLAQAAPAGALAAPRGKPTDQGFALDTYRFKNSASGDLGATARITNTNHGAESAVFTISLVVKGHQVVTLQGTADSAAAGTTISVQLDSHVKYKPAAYTIVFQTDVTKYQSAGSVSQDRLHQS